mgnify:FL=1
MFPVHAFEIVNKCYQHMVSWSDGQFKTHPIIRFMDENVILLQYSDRKEINVIFLRKYIQKHLYNRNELCIFVMSSGSQHNNTKTKLKH